MRGPKRQGEPAGAEAAPVALTIPPAAARAIQLSRTIARPLAWADAIGAHTRTVVGVDFGPGLLRRQRGFGQPGVWGQSLARRFVVGKLRPEPIAMTLSPYLPPQQQLRSSRG